MAITAILEHGVKPSFDLVDETGILTKKVSIKAERDFVERLNAQRMVGYVRGTNPRLTFDISGSIIPDLSGNAQGLAAANPGVAITLLNFTGSASRHGFSASDNKLILLKDAGSELSEEEEPQVSINAQLYPGISAT